MYLTIDIGNSFIKFGFFESNELLSTFSLPTLKSIASYKKPIEQKYLSLQGLGKKVEKIIVASVVESLTKKIIKLLETIFEVKPLDFTYKSSSKFIFNNDNPSEVGDDLIASYYGAKRLYGSNCVVVDLGTATKISLILDGAFQGCLIFPGLDMQKKVFEEKLPHLDWGEKPTKNLVGKNTKDSIINGFYYANIYGIRGIVAKILKTYPIIEQVILSGGHSNTVKDYLNKYTFNPNLVLMGLNEVLRED
ncbi:MAG: type III pantothenate kinase [Bacillales bacterium]|jgi:type III pantothenate kinase|nr:type III pantothenate kinase [Bacillales bacterium]